MTLIVVLALLVLGAIILTPILLFMNTGLEAGQTHESKTEEFYSADAGVEDALWKIKNDNLPDWMLGVWNETAYSQNYTYPIGNLTLNYKNVNVTIQPIWPLDGLEKQPAQRTSNDTLVTLGGIIESGEYQINLVRSDQFTGNLTVVRIGCWLPSGYQYVTNSSNLENSNQSYYYCVPRTFAFRGGTAVEWDTWLNQTQTNNQNITFSNLTGPTASKKIVIFSFTPASTPEGTFSWVNATYNNGTFLSWDVDCKIYKITSTATDPVTGKLTTVTAYTSKSEFRKLGSTINGDYVAIGNSLMLPDPNNSPIDSNQDYRSQLLKQSSATITSYSGPGEVPLGQIPAAGTVQAAYLYWSGFIDHYYWYCNSGTFNLPDRYDAFTISGGAVADNGTITVATGSISVNVTGSATYNFASHTWTTPAGGGNVTVSRSGSVATGGTWTRSASATVAITNDTDGDATVTGQWYFSSDADNGTGTLYNASNLGGIFANAKVGTVSFGTTGAMQDVNATQWQICEKSNDSPGCWYYTCLYDATDLVQQLINNGKLGANGNGIYTLGHASGVIDQTPPRNTTTSFPRKPSDTGSSPSPGYSFTLYNTSGVATSDYTGYPLGTPATKLPSGGSYAERYHASYAGWSLVIIYSSPATLGHQLYLYDINNPNFKFVESFPGGAYGSNPDFDGDGNPGGKISGFLVPQKITGETNAARITCFVGEGDKGKTGDSFVFTGATGASAYLLDGTPGAVSNDTWNSQSLGLSAAGVDIDTLGINPAIGQYITWASNLLQTGDTWAQIDLPTTGDGFTLVYIILSFRSETTSGGILTYLYGGG